MIQSKAFSARKEIGFFVLDFEFHNFNSPFDLV